MRLGGLRLLQLVKGVSIESWMAAVVLVPAPLWFVLRVALDPGPAWRAEYFADTAFGGASHVVEVRRMEQYWDNEHATFPNGADARNGSARFDTCIEVDAPRDVPILLVANGVARFSLGGTPELSGESDGERWVESKVLHLPAGSRRLTIELSSRGWPSIGLLASFDGHAPTAIGSGTLAEGVRTRLPAQGESDCAAD
jgi:hypothetical protein